MKKLLIFLSIIALVAGGKLSYNWYKNHDLSTWSFIPSDAILVFQSNDISGMLKENREKPIWKNLANLPFIKNASEQLNVIDSLLESESFFATHELLLSGHLTSKNSLDLLFALSFDEEKDKSHLSKILEYVDSKGYKKSTRQYLGYDIIERSKDDIQFSFFIYKNLIVGSTTSFLVEDAIRVFDDSDYLNFKAKNGALFGLSKIEKDQGNLYVNSKKLDALIGIFTDPVKTNLSSLSKLTYLSFLDMAINDESIIFSGFSLNSALKGNYLDAFDGVESSEFLMHSVVPTNTSTLFHFSFNEPEKWHKNLKNFWRKNSPELLTNLGELENKFDFPIDDLYGFMGNELGIITLESSVQSADLVAAMHVKDTEQALTFLNKLSNATNSEVDIYSSEYKGYDIRQIAVSEMPMRFFGPLFSGFEVTYYAIENDYVMMTNSEFVMNDLIDNLLSENTWSKSLKMNQFLDIANKESNLSLYVNTKSALDQIDIKLNEKWQPLIEANKSILNKLEFGVAQFSNVDGKFYTNIVLKHSDQIKEEITSTNSSQFIAQTTVPGAIISKPFAVRNHNNRSLEFIVQNDQNSIYLISAKYDTLWSQNVSSKIVSEVNQLDYYKNNKLQYLFATQNQVHIIDRLGTYIPGYPLKIPIDEPIKFLSLIDYNETKAYRILASTKSGKYFMFDKSGENLEGWNPNNLENEPNAKPFHLRVRNSDVLLFTNGNGMIEMLNRKGEGKNGFPLEMNINIDQTSFLEKGASLRETHLTVISEEGELIKFNLEGEIKSRTQIFRNNTNDKFSLTKSSDQRSFLILRKDNNQITILNPKGEELFIHQYPTGNLNSQLYSFSTNHQVLVITDKDQEFTYLYSLDGKLISGQPINTGQSIAMLYQSATNSYKIFLTYGKHFSVINVNR